MTILVGVSAEEVAEAFKKAAAEVAAMTEEEVAASRRSWLEEMRDTGVGVYHKTTDKFIMFCPCPGEKRVRIDVHDPLSNYQVFPGVFDIDASRFTATGPALLDWVIDWT